MPYGMYVSAAGAHVQSRRLEVLSHNLANVDTPGFKRELAVLQARHAEAIEQQLDQPGSRSINDIGGGVQLQETVTDFARGVVKPTGIPTDMAIEDDDAFFLVEKEGRQLLTRAGNFHFASDGRLLTPQGYSVLTPDGAPVRIDPGRGAPQIRDGGVVQQQGDQSLVALVRPQSLADLERVGENLFAARGPLTPAPPAQRNIRSGYLEMSGVNPALAMMELIEASRAYEANVRMIQQQDNLIGALVNRVLRPSS